MSDEKVLRKKISVITAAPTVKNYGSYLLTYATQRLLEAKGFSVEFVNYTRKTLEEATNLADIYRALKKKDISKKWPSIIQMIISVLLYPSIRRLCGSFFPFAKNRLLITQCQYSDEKSLTENPPQADIYCTGGDQMWNEQYNYHKVYREFYLAWVPCGKPRISFSTSVGKDQFEEWEVSEVTTLLKEYSYISVREASAKHALEKMGIPNVMHLQDPTLLLDRSEWEELSSERLVSEEYILLYEVSWRAPLADAALTLSRKTGKKIIRINYYAFNAIKRGKSIMAPSPEEFLSLFRYADYIITNSFHGTAFSIIFNKNFVVIPGDNPGRLQSALKYFALEERVYAGQNSVSDCIQTPIDWDYVEERIKEARTDFDSYIEEVSSSMNNRSASLS
jgi:hypothetical protein